MLITTVSFPVQGSVVIKQLVALLLCIYGLCCQMAWAMSPNLVAWPSPAANQLTSRMVSHIMQDAAGGMWLASQEGLNFYNGQEVINFSANNTDRRQLGSGMVIALAKTRAGKVWVALTSGLQYYDEVNNRFMDAPHAPKVDAPLTAMRIDNQDRIWLAYGNKIAVYRNVSGQHIEMAMFPVNGARQTTVVDFIFDETRSFIVTQGGAIYSLMLGASSIESTHLNTLASDNDSLILVTSVGFHQGAAWIGTSFGGLYTVDLQTGAYQHIQRVSESVDLKDLEITSIYPNGSYVWLTTLGPVIGFDSDDSQWRVYQKIIAADDETGYRSIFQSRDGIYWFGGGSGLTQAMESPLAIKTKANAGLTSDFIYAISEGSDGSVWVGSEHGLDYRAPDALGFTAFDLSVHSALQDTVVMSLAALGDNVWIGTYNSGLFRYHRPSDTLHAILTDADSSTKLNSKSITAIEPIDETTLVVATYGGGVSVLQDDGERIHTFRSAMNADLRDYVFVLQKMQDGSVLAAADNWLARLSPDQTRLEPLDITVDMAVAEEDIPRWPGLIISLQQSTDGTVWMGSFEHGLYRFQLPPLASLSPNYSSPSSTVAQNAVPNIAPLSTRQSVVLESLIDRLTKRSNSIYGIEEDAAGKLWLSHNKGLTRLDPTTLEATTVGVNYGLRRTEFNSGASGTGPSGQLYFGGADGFIVINESLGPSIEVPTIELGLSELMVQGRRLPLSGPDATRRLELTPEDKVVMLKFFGAEYIESKEVEYKYRILGLIDQFITLDNQHVVSLTTLPPGDYELQIAGKGLNGEWNLDGVRLPITVSPPWWGSYFAYVIYALVIALLLFTALRWHWLKEAQSLQRERLLTRRIAEKSLAQEQASARADAALSHGAARVSRIRDELQIPMLALFDIAAQLQSHQSAESERVSKYTLMNAINALNVTFKTLTSAESEPDDARSDNDEGT